MNRVLKNLEAFKDGKLRLPLAVLPNKRVACCCTPETCICKKPVDKKKGSDKLKGK